jgi:hypothetical protein
LADKEKEARQLFGHSLVAVRTQSVPGVSRRRLLERATPASEIPARIRHSNDALLETMWAGEMAALERARHCTRRDGPGPGFLLGANALGYGFSGEYSRQLAALLNHAMLPFYRATVEPTERGLDYSHV